MAERIVNFQDVTLSYAKDELAGAGYVPDSSGTTASRGQSNLNPHYRYKEKPFASEQEAVQAAQQDLLNRNYASASAEAKRGMIDEYSGVRGLGKAQQDIAANIHLKQLQENPTGAYARENTFYELGGKQRSVVEVERIAASPIYVPALREEARGIIQSREAPQYRQNLADSERLFSGSLIAPSTMAVGPFVAGTTSRTEPNILRTTDDYKWTDFDSRLIPASSFAASAPQRNLVPRQESVMPRNASEEMALAIGTQQSRSMTTISKDYSFFEGVKPASDKTTLEGSAQQLQYILQERYGGKEALAAQRAYIELQTQRGTILPEKNAQLMKDLKGSTFSAKKAVAGVAITGAVIGLSAAKGLKSTTYDFGVSVVKNPLGTAKSVVTAPFELPQYAVSRAKLIARNPVVGISQTIGEFVGMELTGKTIMRGPGIVKRGYDYGAVKVAAIGIERESAGAIISTTGDIRGVPDILKRDVSVEVRGRPIESVIGEQRTTYQPSLKTTESVLVFNKGELSPIPRGPKSDTIGIIGRARDTVLEGERASIIGNPNKQSVMRPTELTTSTGSVSTAEFGFKRFVEKKQFDRTLGEVPKTDIGVVGDTKYIRQGIGTENTVVFKGIEQMSGQFSPGFRRQQVQANLFAFSRKPAGKDIVPSDWVQEPVYPKQARTRPNLIGKQELSLPGREVKTYEFTNLDSGLKGKAQQLYSFEGLSVKFRKYGTDVNPVAETFYNPVTENLGVITPKTPWVNAKGDTSQSKKHSFDLDEAPINTNRGTATILEPPKTTTMTKTAQRFSPPGTKTETTSLFKQRQKPNQESETLFTTQKAFVETTNRFGDSMTRSQSRGRKRSRIQPISIITHKQEVGIAVTPIQGVKPAQLPDIAQAQKPRQKQPWPQPVTPITRTTPAQQLRIPTPSPSMPAFDRPPSEPLDTPGFDLDTIPPPIIPPNTGNWGDTTRKSSGRGGKRKYEYTGSIAGSALGIKADVTSPKTSGLGIRGIPVPNIGKRNR